jgi:two-component system, CitB family, sensor kinase
LLVLLVLRSARDLQREAGALLHFGNIQRKRDNGQESMRARVRRLQRLSTQVVIMMVAILVVTMAAGFAVVQRNLSRQLDVQYEHRALAVAQALGSQPGLQQAVLAGDPGGVGPDGAVQAMAMAAATGTGAAFVVVTNRDGIRYSHPKPWLIGTPVGYPDREPAASEPFRTGTP